MPAFPVESFEKVGGAEAFDVYELTVVNRSQQPVLVPGDTYDDLILSDTPAAYWPLDEGSGSAIEKVAGISTTRGGSSYTLGVAGPPNSNGAIYNNGTGSIILSTSGRPITLGASYTIECWLKFDDASTDNIVAQFVDASGYMARLRRFSDGTIGGNYHDAGGNNREIHAPALTAFSWHFVVVVYTATSVTVYVDDKTPYVDSSYGARSLSTVDMQLSYSSPYSVKGTIARLTVYARALTANEVAEHYAGPTGDTYEMPPPKTFYLSRTNVALNGEQYFGIVADTTGASIESAIGGLGAGRITLVINDDLGTSIGFGTKRRFSDWFAARVSGYADPFDLDSAILTVKIAARASDGTFAFKTIGVYDIDPSQTMRDSETQQLTLSFNETRRMHRILPRRKVRNDVWERLPTESASKPIPLLYGLGVHIPGILIDDVEGKYLFTESPADTPVHIRYLEAIVQDRDTQRDKLVALYSPATARVIDTTVQSGAVLSGTYTYKSTGNVTQISGSTNAINFSRYTLVFTMIDDSTHSIATVFRGGQEMAWLGGALVGTNQRLDAWGLVAPSPGVATVTAYQTNGQTAIPMFLAIHELANVDQGTPTGTVVTNVGTALTVSDDVTATAGGLVIDALLTAIDTVSGIGANQTSLYADTFDNRSSGTDHTVRGSVEAGVAGTVTMSWTLNNSANNNWCHIVVPIRGIGTGTTTWVTLTERGQTFRLSKGGLGDKIILQLRPKSGDPAPVGRVTLRLEWTTGSGLPSGDMTERIAGTEIDAALITTEDLFSFKWDKALVEGSAPPIITTDTIAFVVRYAKESGGGDIEIGLSADGGYDNGAACERGTSRDEWIQSERAARIIPIVGLTGDGFLTSDPYYGKTLYDYFMLGDTKVIQVGVVSDGPGDSDTAVGFMRFPLGGYTPADFVRVVLRLYLAEVQGMSDAITFNFSVDEIVDFGALDILDWNGKPPGAYGFMRGPQSSTVLYAFGVVADENTESGTFIDVDVTTAVLRAMDEGRPFIAFRLSATWTSFEGGPQAICFSIVSTEQGGSNVPSLRLIKDGGQDLQFALDMLQFTIEDSINDGTGNNVSLVDFSRPLGERLVAAFIDGMKDDADGTYTGVANAIIENGSDIMRHVCVHPIALGSPSAVNLTSLDAARTALIGWTALAGAIYEPLDSTIWVSRIAASAKSMVFISSGGLLTMLVHDSRDVPVRTIRPEEVRGVKLFALGRSELNLPWSRVDVFYGRDLLALENALGSRSEANEWDGYATVSEEDAFPPDESRVAEATARFAAYGERGNGGASPSDMNSFHFLNADGLTGERGRMMRDFLWDHIGKKVDAMDGLTILLPRFAVNFDVGCVVDVTLYDFPAQFARAVVGEISWRDRIWQRGVKWGAARRGRFTVRSLTVAVNATDLPVSATMKLEEWRS